MHFYIEKSKKKIRRLNTNCGETAMPLFRRMFNVHDGDVFGHQDGKQDLLGQEDDIRFL